MHELSTSADVIEKLGGIAEVAKLTGRKYNAVFNWRVLGSFPASTFLLLNAALADRGLTASPTLWRMVAAQ
jgi:hypothetical protein